MKELLKSANIPVPLLSPARHGLCYSTPEHPEQERICAAYKEQVKIYITWMIYGKPLKCIISQKNKS